MVGNYDRHFCHYLIVCYMSAFSSQKFYNELLFYIAHQTDFSGDTAFREAIHHIHMVT